MISVIIPVFNKKEYLCDAINSILLQTVETYEIILIDDGSTDGSELICKEYDKKCSNIRVIYQNNKGVSAARNAGLELAKGEYITFLDADDMLKSDCFKNCQDLLDKSNVDLIQFGSEVCGENKEELRDIDMITISDNEALSEFYRRKKITPVIWGCIYKREIIQDYQFDEYLHLGEDTLYKFRILKNCNSVGIIDSNWYKNRLVDNSLSRKKIDIEDIENILYALEKINYYEENTPTERKEKEIFLYNQYFAYLNSVVLNSNISLTSLEVTELARRIDSIKINSIDKRLVLKRLLFFLFKNNALRYQKIVRHIKKMRTIYEN